LNKEILNTLCYWTLNWKGNVLWVGACGLIYQEPAEECIQISLCNILPELGNSPVNKTIMARLQILAGHWNFYLLHHSQNNSACYLMSTWNLSLGRKQLQYEVEHLFSSSVKA
jgi:hypothetical protein